MDQDRILAELTKPIAQELLNSHIPARLAYNGQDGFPRVVPVAFLWADEKIVVCTTTNAAKYKHLQHDPKVALTIDTEGFPPRVLLVRGTATTEIVDGIPDEYVEASRKIVPAEGMANWEGGIRSLYKQMVRIVITPTWARLQDFETTLPRNVEELIREAQSAQATSAG